MAKTLDTFTKWFTLILPCSFVCFAGLDLLGIAPRGRRALGLPFLDGGGGGGTIPSEPERRKNKVKVREMTFSHLLWFFLRS